LEKKNGPTDYDALAKEAEERAKISDDPSARETWLKIAALYRRLAPPKQN